MCPFIFQIIDLLDLFLLFIFTTLHLFDKFIKLLSKFQIDINLVGQFIFKVELFFIFVSFGVSIILLQFASFAIRFFDHGDKFIVFLF